MISKCNVSDREYSRIVSRRKPCKNNRNPTRIQRTMMSPLGGTPAKGRKRRHARLSMTRTSPARSGTLIRETYTLWSNRVSWCLLPMRCSGAQGNQSNHRPRERKSEKEMETSTSFWGVEYAVAQGFPSFLQTLPRCSQDVPMHASQGGLQAERLCFGIES